MEPLASVRLVAVGDIMMHQDVKQAGRASADGLGGLWSELEPLWRGAGIVFGNLETPVAPVSGQPGRPFQFNAPAQLPAALRASGFTVLATANNHAFDQGPRAVPETLQRLAAEHLLAVGSGTTRAEAERTRFLEVGGLRIAFLGFTDLLNVNLNRGAGGPWVRQLDPAAAAAAVRAARTQADAVVVSLHWGTEYSHQPQDRQRQVAARLAAAGADLILGHHPHVLQPVEMIESSGHRTLVAYSMGNFISNQDRTYQADQMPVEAGDSRDGVALSCRLVRRRQADGSVRVQVEDAACAPLWTRNNWPEFTTGQAPAREIRVIPVDAAIRTARAGLDRLQGSQDPALARLQDWLHTLEVRRARAMEILGPIPLVAAGVEPVQTMQPMLRLARRVAVPAAPRRARLGVTRDLAAAAPGSGLPDRAPLAPAEGGAAAPAQVLPESQEPVAGALPE